MTEDPYRFVYERVAKNASRGFQRKLTGPEVADIIAGKTHAWLSTEQRDIVLREAREYGLEG